MRALAYLASTLETSRYEAQRQSHNTCFYRVVTHPLLNASIIHAQSWLARVLVHCWLYSTSYATVCNGGTCLTQSPDWKYLYNSIFQHAYILPITDKWRKAFEPPVELYTSPNWNICVIGTGRSWPYPIAHGCRDTSPPSTNDHIYLPEAFRVTLSARSPGSKNDDLIAQTINIWCCSMPGWITCLGFCSETFSSASSRERLVPPSSTLRCACISDRQRDRMEVLEVKRATKGTPRMVH